MNALWTTPVRRITAILFLFSSLVAVGCTPETQPSNESGKKQALEGLKKPDPRDPWPAERIASNPMGFCVWANQQLQEQLNLLQANRVTLSEKSKQLSTKKQSFLGNLEDIRNLSNRAKTALRKAEDEDRWPVKFAGRSFSREKLEALVAVTSKYVEQRGPLADDYVRADRRLELEIRKVDEQIAEVKRQMEVVLLDLERIKLTAEIDGLPQLDSSKLDIIAITRNLGRPGAEEALDLEIDALTRGSDAPMTLDYFLKNDQER